MARTTLTKRQRKKSTGGQLRIGDQWNAINIIASSQTHPLKAICELTENAIDAKATHVQIVRRRSKGQIYLEVVDDGNGIVLDDSGEPNFAHIATHVCDSMKRHLSHRDRDGIHGEFGIGLLSFWSLGQELRMTSAGQNGRLLEMRLIRGKRSYTVHPVRGQLPTGGTRVVVGPLLDTTRNVVTGEKLVRFLAAELRDRIRNTGVRVRIVDRVSRKDLVVVPREFEGDRVGVAQKLTTSFGDVLVELYFRDSSNQAETGVAVCKDGTRVLKDLTELVQFQRSPWSEGRVEGVLDFAALNLAPGTRHGIVPDEQLEAFVEAIEKLEPEVIAAIEQREQAESDKASRQILRQVHKAFVSALRELPSNEYLFFDIPEPKHSLGAGDGKGSGEGPTTEAQQDGIPVAPRTDHPSDEDGSGQELLPLDPGPLATVKITPRQGRRRPGEECQLTATAKDAHGTSIAQGVHYGWRVAEGEGSLLGIDDATCRITSSSIGQVTIEVRATQGLDAAEDQVTVKFLEDVPDSESDTSKGLPSYRLEPEHGKPWRSRYVPKKNEIIINSAHRDFLSSRTTAAKHRRYIGKLYAKEVVLINFPHESPSEVMERLIELMVRTEDIL